MKIPETLARRAAKRLSGNWPGDVEIIQEQIPLAEYEALRKAVIELNLIQSDETSHCDCNYCAIAKAITALNAKLPKEQ